MNFFFTGAVRGGRAHQREYALIVNALEKYGTVFSKHVANDALSQFGETNILYKEIRARELQALEKSDVVVADVTTPSLGVGYLVGRATSLGKKVIALHYGDFALKLTGIVQGDSGIEIHSYKTDEDIRNIFEASLR